MPLSVNTQAYIFICSVAGGMLIAFVYDLFRIKRKAVKTSSLIIQIEDMFFWVIVALIMFVVVYYSNEGEFRGYLFIGTVLGVILYALLLSRIVVGSSIFILRTLFKVLKAVWYVVSYPLRIIIKILSVPIRFFFRKSGSALRKVRRSGRRRLSRMALWGKLLKNIRKKI